MKTKHMHFFNHASSKKDSREFALDLFQSILEAGDGQITLSVDEGNGDVWKYTINFEVEYLKTVTQIKEN